MRERALKQFSAGQLPVLVATDVAARGIDVDGIDVVVHYDPPEDHKGYLHRSGRTARAGKDGLVVTLVLWNEQLEVGAHPEAAGPVRADRRDVLQRPPPGRPAGVGPRRGVGRLRSVPAHPGRPPGRRGLLAVVRPVEVIVYSLVGAALIVAAIGSALRSTVLPRSANSGLARTALRATRLVFRLRAGRSASYERRDRIMAMLGPIALLTMLRDVVGAHPHRLHPALPRRRGEDRSSGAVELSGSSVFTLGTTPSHGLGTDVLSYTEAGHRPAAGHPADHLSAQHLRRLLPPGKRRRPSAGPSRGPAPGRRRC